MRRLVAALWQRAFGSDDPASNRREMDEEMRFHLEMSVERYRRSGLTEAEARRRAYADFGGMEQHQETARDERPLAWFDVFGQDMRYAWRMIGRNLSLTAAICLTIGLGVAASSSIFAVAYAVLLRPLPIPRPNELAYVGWDFGGQKLFPDLTAFQFDFVRANGRGFRGLATYQTTDLDVGPPGSGRTTLAASVSQDFFSVLAQSPSRGRAFVPEEWAADSNRVAIVSARFWKQELGGDSAVLRRPLILAGRPHTIVGVMPATFRLPGEEKNPDVLVPLRLKPSVRDEQHDFITLARLAPSTTQATLDAELARLTRALRTSQPQLFERADQGFVAMSFQDVYVGALSKQLWLLLLAVGSLLLVASVNSANLWVARAMARRGEMSIRVALGAGRGRIGRQLATESLLVIALAAASGLTVGWWTMRFLIAHSPIPIPRSDEVSFLPAALASIAVLAGVALSFGLAAAVPAVRGNLSSRLSQRASSSDSQSKRLRSLLIAAEVALTVLMVSSASLVAKSLYRLMTVDKGFATAGVWTVRLGALPKSYDGAMRGQLARRALERVRALPEVRSAGTVSNFPLERGMNFPVTAEGNANASNGGVELRFVSPGAMEALGLKIKHGRVITAADLSAGGHVAVITETMALRFFGRRNAVGAGLEIGKWKGQWLGNGYHGRTEIVGVVGDVRDVALNKEPRLTVYLPQMPGEDSRLRIVVSTTSPSAAADVARAFRGLDAGVPVPEMTRLNDLVRGSVSVQRYQTGLLAAIGVCALALAAIGIFGIVTYSVQQEMRETAIRIALGASPSRVARRVIGRAVSIVALGSVAGIALTMGVARLVQANLFGVSSMDSQVLIGSVATLLLVGLGACAIPALSAVRTRPIEALRL
jgi:predicted permease